MTWQIPRFTTTIGCAALLFWQKDVVYYFTSGYLEAWAIVLVLTALEHLVVYDDEAIWRPLLLLGTPASFFAEILSRPLLGRVERVLRQPALAWALGTGAIWVWHLPALYNAALAERRDGWAHSKTRINYGDQSAQLTDRRNALMWRCGRFRVSRPRCAGSTRRSSGSSGGSRRGRSPGIRASKVATASPPSG